MSQAHAETQATAMTLTCPTTPGLRILCGNDAAEPPTALATTATVTTTLNNQLSFGGGHAIFYGITFSGTTGNSASNAIGWGTGGTSIGMFFDQCNFTGASTNASSLFALGITGASTNLVDDCLVSIKNGAFKFGTTSCIIRLGALRVKMQNITLDAAGSIPTSLFSIGGVSAEAQLMVEASDLSGRAFTNLVSSANVATPALFDFRNCKLPASISVVGTANSQGPGGPIIKMHNCDSGDTNYRLDERYYEGSIVHETTIVKTSGASDGTTPISYKMVSSANTKFWDPLQSPEIRQWNNTTGSSITATIEFIHDSVTNLQDDEIWLEVQYLGTSGVPLGTMISDRMTDILSTAADQADSSVAWTTTGLTNPNTQKLNVSFTPQEKGVLIAKVMVANPSQTVYIDPIITIT